jgi:CspA family cold shock protein
MNGKVKWFNKTKGFGFISVASGEDHFFHVTQVKDDTPPGEGDMVSFTPGDGKNGKPTAINVIITEKALPGSNAPYYGTAQYTDVYVRKSGTGHAGKGAIGGATVGTIIGGPVGGLVLGFVGTVMGAMACDVEAKKVEITSTCLRCGGTGQVTSEVDGRLGFQCQRCKKFWSKNKEQVCEEIRSKY